MGAGARRWLSLLQRFIRSRRGIWSFTAEARVDDTLVCEAEIMCTTAGRGGN